MIYCVKNDLYIKYGRETINDLADTGEGSDLHGTIVLAIESMSEKVDSYVGARYTLPITGEIPKAVTDITIRLVRHELYAGKTKVPEFITKDNDLALAWLKLVAEGKVLLKIKNQDNGAKIGVSSKTRAAAFNSVTSGKRLI